MNRLYSPYILFKRVIADYKSDTVVSRIMSSPIPSIEDIRKMAGIPVFKVEENLEWLAGPALIGDNDIESVMEFADVVGAKALFVQYDYPDFDDYFIDPDGEDCITLFDEDDEEDLLDAIEEHNDDFQDFLDENYDGERLACSVYVMYEGQAFGMFVLDDALLESFGEDGGEFLVRKFIEYYCDDDEDLEDEEEDD